MTDEEIISLYYARSQEAIRETDQKYGRYCYAVAYRILADRQDSDECVNDTYLRTWKSIPPKHPAVLSAFLGKIARNLALDRYDRYTAEKRGGGQMALALDELEECIPAQDEEENVLDRVLLVQVLNQFLDGLPDLARRLFIGRYWYLETTQELARQHQVSESNVKSSLFRSRNKLRKLLEKEGIAV